MLLFVGSLSFFAQPVRAEGSRSRNRSKTICFQSRLTAQRIFRRGLSADVLQIYEEPKPRDSFRATFVQQHSEFHDLHELLKDDPAQLAMLDTLQASADKGIVLLQDFEHRLQAKESINGLDATVIYTEFNKAGIDFTNKEHEFVNAETEKHRIDEEEAEKSKALVKGFLLSGVSAALLVGALLVFFMRNTTGRLAKLMENTVLLRSNQPLLPALEGADEMARLDRSFHTDGRRPG